VKSILGQGMKREQNYDWLGATEYYRKALCSVPELDFHKSGQIQERIGCAFYKAGMQAENTNQFRERMREAVASYEEAKESYEMPGKEEKKPWILRCDAMVAWLNYWLLSNAPEKKKSLDECWRLTKESLKAFEKAGDMLEYGKTYNQLSSAAFFDYALAWDFHAREKMIKEATEHGERTITLFSGSGNSQELAKAYVKTALYLTIIGLIFIPDMDEKEGYYKKGLEYWQKATELSEEAAFLELLSFYGESLNWSYDDLLVQYDKALGYAKRTKDKYLIGTALDVLAYATSWKCSGIEDPDKRLEFLQKALQYAEGTNHQFSSISFISPRGSGFCVESAIAEYYWTLARWENDLSRKRDLLEKALMEGVHALKQAEKAGYPEITRWAHHLVSGTLVSLAERETDSEEKRRLLEEALKHRKEYMDILELLSPFFYWNLGAGWIGLAYLKAELSTFEKDVDNRRNMLEEAASVRKRGLQLCSRHMPHFEKIGNLEAFAILGRFQYTHGVLLNRLYELTKKKEYQGRAVEAFEEAAQSYQELNMVGRMAECNWKAAISCDRLGEHLKATEYFDLASNNYVSASVIIPQLKRFYSDHASYMKAWAELEKSRHEHENENYARSSEHYRMCSHYLEITEEWNHLSSYYLAWSLLEHGESLSRLDEPQNAIEKFNEASQTFVDAISILRRKVEKIRSSEARDEAYRLMNTARLRRQYCIGKALMEEAKLSNGEGDKSLSAKKYASAARIFKEIAPSLEEKRALGELKFAGSICLAWQKMELAEERGNALLYKKAGRLFAEAAKVSPTKTGELAAIGNSCFCEALELGMKYMVTSNLRSYSGAKMRMENAAGYYRKAGFEKLAELVEATKRLLDAYVYISKAEADADPEKRSRFYLMAEKCLELAAKSYGKAKHHDKKKETLQNLERVKTERELAFSLSEVLSVPNDISNITRVSMLYSTEKAAGLDEFESASIRARLSVPKEFVPSEEFEVKLDLANVGKKPGLLVRIDGLVPSRCRVVKMPSYCALEGASLNMKGRKLDPLSVESVSISVQIADVAGVSLSPQVVYADDLGNFRTIRAEETKIQAVVEFGHKVAQLVFNYLVNSFIEDRVKQRLGVEKAGWRSLPQIIKETGVSKRSMYGAGGRLGPSLYELQRKGLANLETFLGERGRGGQVLRVRIYYQKELVRRYVKEKAPDVLT
jgi:tetratricopeptide (TPR) repeat protein